MLFLNIFTHLNSDFKALMICLKCDRCYTEMSVALTSAISEDVLRPCVCVLISHERCGIFGRWHVSLHRLEGTFFHERWTFS